MDELVHLYARYKRGKKEPDVLRRAIEAYGGEILHHRQISRLVNSPFAGVRVFPLIYEFRVTHGSRRGLWFIRTSDDGSDPDWAWLDLDGNSTLPIEHPTAQVANNVQAVSWVADIILVGGLLIVGVAVSVGVVWIFF